jgi:hypothetical protein
LLPFLHLVFLEDNHHRFLFPFRNSYKARQVFEAPPHYTSTRSFQIRRGSFVPNPAGSLNRAARERFPESAYALGKEEAQSSSKESAQE